MPEMDGLAATEAIRAIEADEGLGRVPIVALTAHVMEEDRQRCLKAGMDAALTKPIRPREVYGELARLTRSVSSDAKDVEPPMAGESTKGAQVDTLVAPAGTAALESDPIRGLVNWPHARKTTLDDEALLLDIVLAVLQELPALVVRLQESIAATDHPAVYRAAHTIKGALRTFDAIGPMRTCEEIEALGKAEESDAAGELLSNLDQDVDKVICELQRFTSATESG